MKLFQTYKEAVIDNNSTRGVFTTHEKWMGVPEMYGLFSVEEDTISPVVDDRKWIECDPYNYLETLESFLASGKRLREEDTVVQDNASVVVLEYEDVEDWNNPDIDDNKRFVLQAATDDVEVSEGKGVFGMIPNQFTIGVMNSVSETKSYDSFSEVLADIDTTPQQVESISASGKLHDSAFLVGSDKFILCDHIKERVGDSCVVHYQFTNSKGYEMCAIEFEDGFCHCVVPQCLETPEERKERERDEMEKQLMIDMHGNGIFDKRDWDYQKRYSLSAQQALNLIDAGYRKKESK